MKKDFRADAEKILEAIGGKDNVISVTHCMTRLRFNLADEDLASDSEVEAVGSVLRVIRQGGQYQVVIGNDVPKVYAAITSLGVSKDSITDAVKKDGSGPKQNIFSRFFGFVAGCMTPLLPAMLGGGMVKVLVTLLTTFGWLSTDSTTYSILAIIGDALFYFLPILLAASIAERLGSSKPLAMLIAGVLLHPDLAALFAAGPVRFLGLPVTSAVYASSVLPVFIMIPIMKYIEDFADKISPSLIKVFFKPLLVVLISAPLALIVVGPIGAILGNYLADGINFLYARAGWLTIAVLAAIMPFVVMTGMHYSLVPIATISLSSLGYDPIVVTTMFCSNLAQGAASLAVALRSKDKSVKQIATGAGVSAVVAGVTEPALYGVTMKYKTPLIAACIASGAAGVFAGVRGLVAYTMGGSPSVFSLIQMVGGDTFANLISGLITMAIVLILSFTLTLILYREKSPVAAGVTANGASAPSRGHVLAGSEPEAAPVSTAIKEKVMTIASPLTGSVLPLSEVSDETFAQEILGKGCAIVPSDGHLYSPVNGKIVNLFDTHHALTILSDDGTELLIHVGRDTVSLGGRYFTAYRKSGDELRTGDLILSFDLDALDKEGYDLTTPIVITNSALYSAIDTTAEGSVTAGDYLLTLHEDDSHLG